MTTQLQPPPSGRTPIRPNHAFDPDAEGVSTYAVRGDDPRVNRLGVGPEPQNPTNGIYALTTPAATAGTFFMYLQVDDVDLVTAPISFDAAAEDIRDALDDVLGPLGYDEDDLLVEGGPLQPGDETVTIEWQESLGGRSIALNGDGGDLVDGFVIVAQVQDGSPGTTGNPQGALIVDVDHDGALWVNLGGNGAPGENPPDWQLVPGGAATLSAVLNAGNDADSHAITGLPDPVDPNDAANKQYVDANSAATPSAVLFPDGSGGVQAIPTGGPGTGRPLALGAPTVDTDAYWSVGSPTLTVPVTGLYRASLSVDMNEPAVPFQLGFLAVGVTMDVLFQAVGGTPSVRRVSVTKMYRLEADDQISPRILHGEVGDHNVYVLEFSVEFLGAA